MFLWLTLELKINCIHALTSATTSGDLSIYIKHSKKQDTKFECDMNDFIKERMSFTQKERLFSNKRNRETR